jgi:hypothetical protein
MQSRKVFATAVAACAFIAVAPSGALAAKKPHKHHKKSAPVVAKQVQANKAQTEQAIAELRAQLKTLQDLVAKLDAQSGGVAAILAAAPQIIDGLTQLKNGLETLGSAYQSVEYGIAQVNVVGGGAIVNPPAWSADIPDDGNGASVSGTALWPNFGPAATKTFTINARIRTNEANKGESGPVAQGGGFMVAEVSYPSNLIPGQFLLCNGDGTTGGVGGITPAGEPIVTPTGTIKDQPLTNILTASSRTDQVLPGGDAPKLASCTVSVPGAVGGAPAIVAIHWQASFLDIPRTASPGPKD